MAKQFFTKSFLLLALSVIAVPVFLALYSSEKTVSAQTGDAPGSLIVMDPAGKPKATCPLKHTDVKAEISGFISRVVVTQQFETLSKKRSKQSIRFLCHKRQQWTT